jgi:hypothetical protein
MLLCIRFSMITTKMIYYASKNRGLTLWVLRDVIILSKVRMFWEGRQIPSGDLPTPHLLTANGPKL